MRAWGRGARGRRRHTHQWLQGADVLELVPAQVQMRQVDQTFCQQLQTAGYPVVTQLQLQPQAGLAPERAAASPTVPHLFQFVQLGDPDHTAQAHVDEAEQLQVGELFRDSLDPPAGATVVQDQLLHLRGAESHTHDVCGAFDVQLTPVQFLGGSLNQVCSPKRHLFALMSSHTHVFVLTSLSYTYRKGRRKTVGWEELRRSHVGTDPESVYKLPTRDAAVSCSAHMLTLLSPFRPPATAT